MLDPHEHRHLQELREHISWVRSLTPDSPRYKLWLGDVVEFVNTVYGRPSPQMEALSAILQESRAPAEADDETRRRAYLARLDAVDRLLQAWESADGA